MEIGISTASYFQKTMIEDAITEIGRRGVPLCELFLNSFSEYEPDFISLLEERLAASGVRAYSVHPMSTQFEPQLFSIHPRQRQDAWALYERVLRGAQRLKAQVYVMHGPVHLSGAAKNISLDRIAPIFLELSELAASYGVTLALENVSWCVFCTPEFGRALREATGDRLSYTLDVKQAARSGFDPLAFADAAGGRIVNVHLCDYTRAADGALRLAMPGLGGFDFSRLCAALNQNGVSCPAFIEVYSDMYKKTDALYASAERMRRIFA